MSIKKRFEQIEAEKPEGPKKTSLLEKFSFKRKLEIEGVAREQLPAEKIAPKTNPKSTVNQTPEVKVTHVYRPENEKAPVQTKPVVDESKIELENLAQEIEIAEQRKRTRAAQQQVIQTQKKLEQTKREQLEDARQRVESAKSKVFWGVIAVVVFGFIAYQLSKSGGMGRRGSGGDFLWLILAIVAGVFGRRRSWWDRW